MTSNLIFHLTFGMYLKIAKGTKETWKILVRIKNKAFCRDQVQECYFFEDLLGFC